MLKLKKNIKKDLTGNTMEVHSTGRMMRKRGWWACGDSGEIFC